MSEYSRLSGTHTLNNLVKAFIEESQVWNRYLIYAGTARKKNHRVIEEVFLETADNERAHGEVFYEYLAAGVNDTVYEASVYAPIVLGSIAENLSAASLTEYEEWSNTYPVYARMAEEEGFAKIARSFEAIITVEKRHDMRFREYLERHNTRTLFLSDDMRKWECINCGWRHIGTSALDSCPVCHHPKEYFKRICDDYY